MVYIAALGHHLSLWPKITTFERLPSRYLWLRGGHNKLRSNREVIHDQKKPQFAVAKGHNISKVTVVRIIVNPMHQL